MLQFKQLCFGLETFGSLSGKFHERVSCGDKAGDVTVDSDTTF